MVGVSVLGGGVLVLKEEGGMGEQSFGVALLFLVAEAVLIPVRPVARSVAVACDTVAVGTCGVSAVEAAVGVAVLAVATLVDLGMYARG